MAVGKDIKKSFETAFHAVRKANVARQKVRRGTVKLPASSLPKSAVLNFHGVGPAWTGKPTITLRLTNGNNAHRLYCFNLTPAIERHRGISRSKPSGFFFTSSHWDSIGRSSMVLLSRKISNLPKDYRLPLSGPSGFVDYMEKVMKNIQMPRYNRQFLDRYVLSDKEETYKTDSVEISKIISNPSCLHSCFIAPTASYVCEVSFDQDSMDDSRNAGTSEIAKELNSENAICCNTFAVLDCPTVQHFDQIKESLVWRPYHQFSPLKQMSAIVHLTSNDVFNSDAYKNWIANFGLNCKHLIVSDTSPYIYSVKDYKRISKLHNLSPVLFPCVCENHVQKLDRIENNIYKVDVRMKVSLNGDSCEVVPDDWRVHEEDVVSARSRWSEISIDHSHTLDKLSKNMEGLKSPNCAGYFPSISVLGSGSVHENVLRAQPGFLLRIDKDNSILMDCGEQTLERLHLTFGDSAKEVLASIKLILLSHRHLDHHAGFYGMMDAIFKSGNPQKQKVFCLMPSTIHMVYSDFLSENADFVDICFLSNEAYGALSKDKASEIIQALPIKSIIPVRVDHNVLTFGIVIVTSCGKKIAYSSDTLPMSSQLVKHGSDADLLIHDCLYIESTMEMEAKLRKHGYLNGALETSDAMNAKFMLLTHFAPQYPLLPIESLPEKYATKVSPALDYMCVSLSDLHKLPYMMSTIEEIFKDKLARGRARSHSLCLRRAERNAMVQELSSLFELNK